jgi:hypothetical protein
LARLGASCCLMLCSSGHIRNLLAFWGHNPIQTRITTKLLFKNQRENWQTDFCLQIWQKSSCLLRLSYGSILTMIDDNGGFTRMSNSSSLLAFFDFFKVVKKSIFVIFLLLLLFENRRMIVKSMAERGSTLTRMTSMIFGRPSKWILEPVMKKFLNIKSHFDGKSRHKINIVPKWICWLSASAMSPPLGDSNE